MTRHLCISVTLLDGRFHGWGDESPEWPPSPMRLFQALLAGARTGAYGARWSNAEADAMRWLEGRPPPVIITPGARRGGGYTMFVPNNDGDKERHALKGRTSKRVCPHVVIEPDQSPAAWPTVHYVWAIADHEWPEAEGRAHTMARLARRLYALGWGIDQAVAEGRVLQDADLVSLEGDRWLPQRIHRPVGSRLRTPVDRSLEDLERAYASVVGILRGKRYGTRYRARHFARVQYLRECVLPPRAFAAYELPDGVAFRQEDAVAVAAMLRSLACRERQDFADQFPADDTGVYLAGHVRGAGDSPARFSYLPLPSIGHAHADGMVRRVLIAEPFGGDGRRAEWAQQRLMNQPLVDTEGNERGVLMGLWRRSSRQMVSRYVDSARVWSSVTPVILPGFDDNGWKRGIPPHHQRRGRPTKAERLFVRALEQAGIPLKAVDSFTLRKAPFWPGSQHPNRYRRPDYLDAGRNRRFSAWHVHVRFRDPVAGPLSLGAGRHCGLGVLAGHADGTDA